MVDNSLKRLKIARIVEMLLQSTSVRSAY